MGFSPVPRDRYTALCEEHGRGPGQVGRWSVEADRATVAAWRPEGGAPAL